MFPFQKTSVLLADLWPVLYSSKSSSKQVPKCFFRVFVQSSLTCLKHSRAEVKSVSSAILNADSFLPYHLMILSLESVTLSCLPVPKHPTFSGLPHTTLSPSELFLAPQASDFAVASFITLGSALLQDLWVTSLTHLLNNFCPTKLSQKTKTKPKRNKRKQSLPVVGLYSSLHRLL